MSRVIVSALWTVIAGLPLVIACGSRSLPATGGYRASGQSKLLDDTFAGKQGCDPDKHPRPFIIEWDATDMSSFEAHASDDVVIVHYEGCELRVLDECRNDSLRGSLGTYRPVSWTTGSLETIDIADEGQLYARLPLGASTLSGKVKAGEKLHMEYYVAGTRNATRSSLYRGDLKDLPGCEDATHFVYAYNLGAFALGTTTDVSAKGGGSLYGFGAGADRWTTRKAEKRGGDLSTCKSDEASEGTGCKAPIRLALRAIREGRNPHRKAARAPDTDASLNAAGRLEARSKAANDAQQHLASAQQKFGVRDGKGCLAELDAHDQLRPDVKTTDPKSGPAVIRAICLMLAGQCRPGKDLARRSKQATSPGLADDQVDMSVEGLLSNYCEGDALDPDDALRRAFFRLQQGADRKTDASVCEREYRVVKRLFGKVKPANRYDSDLRDGDRRLSNLVGRCLALAGRCGLARRLYIEGYSDRNMTHATGARRRQLIEAEFQRMREVQENCP